MTNAGCPRLGCKGLGVLPTLDKVLDDVAPYPYTLKSFREYLSQNHCLEPLDFLEEIKRYTDAYRSAERSRPSKSPALLMTWQNLVSAYILPGSSYELNISTEERNSLLQYNHMSFPPSPVLIEDAVRRIAQSLESSIFLSYLASRSALAHMAPSTKDYLRNERLEIPAEKFALSTPECASAETSSESVTKDNSGKGWKGDMNTVCRKLLDFLTQPVKLARSHRRLSQISNRSTSEEMKR
ncbi:hypothetical protein BDV28DRAFT_145909 [Aspergillus coremiiformis]|uniref:RGS domain-containing protein n=1 Tax=Aspergillus coremiiformis TaxID=138285 RepID=A0A5N6ZDJ7_9EURO|nr:hypothetical protein BDV28DRAFT_145909 [Aspergillus coremiiformis]